MTANKIRNKLFRFITFLISCWFLASLALLIFANKIIFFEEYSKGPIQSFLNYEEVFYTYDKDETLYITQSLNKKSDIVILFFHGNGGKVGRIINAIAPKYNIVAPAYPGYHLSSGKPSEELLYKTVDLSFEYLNKLGIENKNIIVFGASLGGAGALYAAKNYPDVKDIILVGTFDKVASVCKEIYHIFCTFAGNIFDNTILAKQIKDDVRIHQFHSVQDEVINYNFGNNLFNEISTENKNFTTITGGHDGFRAIEIIDEVVKSDRKLNPYDKGDYQ